MEKYVLENTNQPRVKFVGDLIASASEETGTGTSQTFKLYKTSFGRYVGQKQMLTQWAGSKDTFIVATLEDEEDMFAFFGYSDLAKEIYYEANVDESLEIK